MFFDFDSYSYYVRPGFTDARKSFRTISCIVDEEMGLDPRAKAMFIFCNKARNALKILMGTTVLESEVPFPFSIGSYNLTDYLAHLFLNCNRIKNGDRDA